ncbi:hypothetical protein ACQF36_22510 [Streptomyces sp. Marseille-Q5077]|uniref:hypothetical protein n=1 Tax=Streptomyces sp. Marseille-Q5077 TaxID=3418995 RepID=UPI003CFF34A0
MNTATLGLVGAVTAALIAALAATLGPLVLHRRKERAEDLQRAKDDTTRRVDLVNEVGVHCRSWLLYMVRVLEDTEAGRALTVDAFDEKSAELRTAAEHALAQAVHAGYELSDSGLADALRAMDARVRASLIQALSPPEVSQLREEASSYFTPRAEVRVRMINEVTRQDSPTDPLVGTVFEHRHSPRP